MTAVDWTQRNFETEKISIKGTGLEPAIDYYDEVFVRKLKRSKFINLLDWLHVTS